jgi:hypothetical protein
MVAPKITAEEARRIAHQFFDCEIHSEGDLGQTYVWGDSWAFPVRLGYAGTVQREPIVVDRNTGAASWAELAEYRVQFNDRRSEECR